MTVIVFKQEDYRPPKKGEYFLAKNSEDIIKATEDAGESKARVILSKHVIGEPEIIPVKSYRWLIGHNGEWFVTETHWTEEEVKEAFSGEFYFKIEPTEKEERD